MTVFVAGDSRFTTLLPCLMIAGRIFNEQELMFLVDVLAAVDVFQAAFPVKDRQKATWLGWILCIADSSTKANGGLMFEEVFYE